MTFNIKTAIARWLACDEAIYNLLLQCSFTTDQETEELTIDCPSNLVDAIVEHSQTLGEPGFRLKVKIINLTTSGKLKYRFSPHLALRYRPELRESPLQPHKEPPVEPDSYPGTSIPPT